MAMTKIEKLFRFAKLLNIDRAKSINELITSPGEIYVYSWADTETLVSLCSLPIGNGLTFCVVGIILLAGNNLRIVYSICKQRLEDVNS